MLIPTNLIANPAIVQGLADGSLVRYGGIIRNAAGAAQGGQIVAHLSEAAGLTSQLATLAVAPPLGVAQLALNAAGHAATFNKLAGIDLKIFGLQQTAAQILGVTQIAAGASVLGLGVSIAGFAYMGYKLNQVQKSITQLQQNINELQQSVNQGFQNINNRLDKISGQLAYIYLLLEDNRQQQQRIIDAIAHLHQALLIQEIANLQSELENLRRFPDDSPQTAIKAAAKARIFLANQATQAQLQPEPNTLLLVDIATQGWAVATATEAQLLLKHGHIQDAQALLRETLPQFQQHTENWGRTIIHDQRPELNTAQRFATSPFKPHITPERVDRIIRISPIDQNLGSDRAYRKRTEAEVELTMHRTKPHIDQHWQRRQIALAEYLDTISELTARLDSLLAFADLCAAQNVQTSTQLLPPADALPGLYLLPA